jgi:hypothetical protein
MKRLAFCNKLPLSFLVECFLSVQMVWGGGGYCSPQPPFAPFVNLLKPPFNACFKVLPHLMISLSAGYSVISILNYAHVSLVFETISSE